MIFITSTEMIKIIKLLKEGYIESSKNITPIYNEGYINGLNDIIEIIKEFDKKQKEDEK